MENTAAKKAKAPIAAIILTVLGILGLLCSLGFNITVNFLPQIGLHFNFLRTALFGSAEFIGMILFLVGLFMHRKCGSILCGAGVVLYAIPSLGSLFTGTSLFFISTDLTLFLFLVIAAVFYFTKIKILGMPIKLIFGLFAIIASFVAAGGVPYLITQSMNGAGIIADFEGFFYTLTHNTPVIFSFISNILASFTALYFYAAIICFTPKKG